MSILIRMTESIITIWQNLRISNKGTHTTQPLHGLSTGPSPGSQPREQFIQIDKNRLIRLHAKVTYSNRVAVGYPYLIYNIQSRLLAKKDA